MNKKQLYESIMLSVAKQVKKNINEFYDLNFGYDEDDEEIEEKVSKEFSHEDLEELKEIILNDNDFYQTFCSYANFDYYDSYEEAVYDFINFLENDIYSADDQPASETHAWYILDEPDLGTAWMRLKSGKIANLDNIWQEFKSIISQK